MDNPSLRVQLGPVRLVVDPYLGPNLNQLFERLWLGRTHIGRCDDTDAALALNDVGELVDERPYTRPTDETHEEVDVRCAWEFAADLLTDRRLCMAIDKQFVRRQRDHRARREDRYAKTHRRPEQTSEQSRRKTDRVVVRNVGRVAHQDLDHPVDRDRLGVDRLVSGLHVFEGAANGLSGVAPETLRGISYVELSQLCKLFAHPCQAPSKAERDQLITQPRYLVGHAREDTWRACGREVSDQMSALRASSSESHASHP